MLPKSPLHTYHCTLLCVRPCSEVDLGALGLNGVEPDAFKSLRNRFLSNSLFASILDGLPSAAKDAIFEPLNVAKKSVEALSKTA